MISASEIFKYEDYRKFVRAFVESMPKSGRGQYRKMAEALRVNSVTISQIFSGQRELNPDQAFDLAEYLGLQGIEFEYFMALTQLARSGHYRHESYLLRKIKDLKKQAKELKRWVGETTEISDEAKAIFYSDWAYSAVRILCSIPQTKTAQQIAETLQLGLPRVQSVLEFLIRYGLVVNTGHGYEIGTRATHLEAASPLVKARQLSWRLKASEYMDNSSFPKNLFYTGPCSISEEDFDQLRDELLGVIKGFVGRVGRSQPSQLACLNIDLFKLS